MVDIWLANLENLFGFFKLQKTTCQKPSFSDILTLVLTLEIKLSYIWKYSTDLIEVFCLTFRQYDNSTKLPKPFSIFIKQDICFGDLFYVFLLVSKLSCNMAVLPMCFISIFILCLASVFSVSISSFPYFSMH